MHNQSALMITGMMVLGVILCFPTANSWSQEDEYAQVQTVLTQYCAGCHNPDEANAGFRVDQFDELLAGGESGSVITPGSAATSRLLGIIKHDLEPAMPPAGEPQPNHESIQLIADWIDAGAIGPAGMTRAIPMTLDVPSLTSLSQRQAISAITVSPDQQFLAIGRFGSVEILGNNQERNRIARFDSLPGKVNAITFAPDGKRLMVGTGIAGAAGEVVELTMEPSQSIGRRFRGHRDSVYSVAVSPDGRWLASASYDKSIKVWGLAADDLAGIVTNETQELLGHNGAVFDVGFSPDSKWLLSASADSTLKVWDVHRGIRLDTRGEPLESLLALAVDTQGWVFAAGEDNRIRKWRLQLDEEQKTLPLVENRFAHEAAVEHLQLHPNQPFLVSVGADRLVKVWDRETLELRYAYPPLANNVQALAVAEDQIWLADWNGKLTDLPWPQPDQWLPEIKSAGLEPRPSAPPVGSAEFNEISEAGLPNATPKQALLVEIPAKVTGDLAEEESVPETGIDWFQFEAQAGQSLVIEARAAAMGSDRQDGQTGRSSIDTRIMVCDDQGKPIPRTKLRAVRDSYFTFRGKNSTQVSDFRIHNWEEMQLGQYLYCNGEVVRLYHYPRGPDSGFNVFPNFGRRQTMFGTTATSHALQEPCFIVEPYPPESNLPNNGLPEFIVNYVNDDDPERELGSDSRMLFRVPRDGTYWVAIEDARGFAGQELQYDLTIRPPQPDFEIKSILGGNPQLVPGGYRQVGVEIDRIDQFAGPVKVEVVGLPTGVKFIGPVVVDPELLRAWFVLHADSDLDAEGLKENQTDAKVVLTGAVGGQTVRRQQPLGKITVAEEAPLLVQLEANLPTDQAQTFANGVPVIEIGAGQTAEARIIVTRNGHRGRISFGQENAAVNAPFGVYVANIGLNGVLLPPGETERVFFINAEPWMSPGDHLVFVQAAEAGKPASNPLLLRVTR